MTAAEVDGAAADHLPGGGNSLGHAGSIPVLHSGGTGSVEQNSLGVAPVRTVRLRRRLAGCKYASAALLRSPRRWVTAVGAYPVLSGSFSSPRRRRPSSAHAARNADVVGLGSRSSEMNCGPGCHTPRPRYCPPGARPAGSTATPRHETIPDSFAQPS